MAQEISDFRKSLLVNPDETIDLTQIEQVLEKSSAKYRDSSKSNVDVYRSGKIMAFDALLSVGLLFKLYETCGKTVDAHILTREKSAASIKEKKTRKGREAGKELGDIIGSSLILDRVHNFPEIVNIFDSPEIQSRYNERQANIILLNEISNFILSLDPDNHNIATGTDDNYSKNNSELVSRLNLNKKDCKKIQKNCNIYFKQSNIKDIQKFPINRTFKSMCKYLMEEEFQRAFDIMEINLQREIKSKNDLEEQLEKLIQNNIDDIQEIVELREILKVQDSKIDVLAAQINSLKRNPKKSAIQMKALLSNSLNNSRIELLEDIENHINGKIDSTDNQNESSIEQKYCEYLIILLYQIKKLEFVKDKDQFKGKTYETVESTLYSLLKEYRDTEIYKNCYANITYDDIQKLTTNLNRLNSRLSDRLQHEILDYSMELYLKDVIKQFTGEYPANLDFKIRSNGYVATHLDIEMVRKVFGPRIVQWEKELKLMTHHRDIQATTGTAAYGSGRQVNRDAKKRKEELLKDNLEHHINLTKGPKVKLVNYNGKNNSKLIERAREANNLNNLIMEMENDTDTENSEKGKHLQVLKNFRTAIRERKNWQQELFSVVPQYSTVNYNAKKDSVEITFFSDYENVKKYYTETNIPVMKSKVEKKLKELRTKKMISDQPIKIEITHDQYRDFMKNHLCELKSSVEDLLVRAVIGEDNQKKIDTDNIDVGDDK